MLFSLTNWLSHSNTPPFETKRGLNVQLVNQLELEKNDEDHSVQCVVSPVVVLVTAPPPCVPQASLNGTLYRVTNPTASMSAYTCFAYTWIATGLTATLSFFFRHDPSNWRLDEVKVYHGFTQLITNGGFENGFDNWTLVGSCNIFSGSVPNSASNAKAGSYYYKSPCALYGQTLSQTFPTVIGDTYVISFWLINDGCCGTTVIANITVS